MRLASSLTANEVVNATQAEYSLLGERSYYIKNREMYDVGDHLMSPSFHKVNGSWPIIHRLTNDNASKPRSL